MKVILIDEIRGLGVRGDVVNVKDGYARNYLLPKNLAREATPGNVKAAEQERGKWAKLAAQEKEAAQKVAADLQGVRIVVHKRVGETGTLFGSVTANEIADALTESGYQVDKRRIELGSPIKTLGTHDVEIRLHREVPAHIQVEVIGAAETEALTEVLKAEEAAETETADEEETAETEA